MKRSVDKNGENPPSSKQKKTRPADEEPTDDELSSGDYFEENGLRKVTPYDYKYKTHAKRRWIGQSLIGLFSKEFQDRPAGYYETAIKEGVIQINGNMVDLEYIIRNEDLITHSIHRHEPPIPAGQIPIIAQTNDYLVVNKPPGVPIHPSGRYHHNTLLGCLLTELRKAHPNHGPLFALHRLDRLTSGVVILCKTRSKISAISKEFHQIVISKQYICRVDGEFPVGLVTVDEPIMAAQAKLGLHGVNANGKPSKTHFIRLKYDSNLDTSIVLAVPATGRTHQIRVHLKHLRYPIVNDPLYNDRNYQRRASKSANNLEPAAASIDETEQWFKRVMQQRENTDQQIVGKCNVCDSDLYKDPACEELMLYLHAYKYSVRFDLGFSSQSNSHGSCEYDESTGITSIRTPIPDWASIAESDIIEANCKYELTRSCSQED